MKTEQDIRAWLSVDIFEIENLVAPGYMFFILTPNLIQSMLGSDRN